MPSLPLHGPGGASSLLPLLCLRCLRDTLWTVDTCAAPPACLPMPPGQTTLALPSMVYAPFKRCLSCSGSCLGRACSTLHTASSMPLPCGTFSVFRHLPAFCLYSGRAWTATTLGWTFHDYGARSAGQAFGGLRRGEKRRGSGHTCLPCAHLRATATALSSHLPAPPPRASSSSASAGGAATSACLPFCHLGDVVCAGLCMDTKLPASFFCHALCTFARRLLSKPCCERQHISCMPAKAA